MFGVGIGSVAESMLYDEVEKLRDSVNHWRKVADNERGEDKDELLTEINDLRQIIFSVESDLAKLEKRVDAVEKDMMEFQRELLKLVMAGKCDG